MGEQEYRFWNQTVLGSNSGEPTCLLGGFEFPGLWNSSPAGFLKSWCSVGASLALASLPSPLGATAVSPVLRADRR